MKIKFSFMFIYPDMGCKTLTEAGYHKKTTQQETFHVERCDNVPIKAETGALDISNYDKALDPHFYLGVLRPAARYYSSSGRIADRSGTSLWLGCSLLAWMQMLQRGRCRTGEQDVARGNGHWQHSGIGGHPKSRRAPGVHEFKNMTNELALRHWMISVKIGEELSWKNVAPAIFMDGRLATEAQYDDASKAQNALEDKKAPTSGSQCLLQWNDFGVEEVKIGSVEYNKTFAIVEALSIKCRMTMQNVSPIFPLP